MFDRDYGKGKVQMIKVYENVLEDHVALGIHEYIKNVSWKHNYPSAPNKPDRHWHVLCGADGDLFFDYDFLSPIWNTVIRKYDFKNTYSVQKFRRAYMNAHDYGSEPQMHYDDGDFTMLYYPRVDWNLEWGGGTLIIEDGKNHLIDYVPNSLVIFDANLKHAAQVVSRNCHELRTVVVFKCDKSIVV